MTSFEVIVQGGQAKNQLGKAENYFCETIDTQKHSPNDSNLETSFTNNQNRKIGTFSLSIRPVCLSLQATGPNSSSFQVLTI